jgi:DNA-binding MarR family transcriptional regulator
MDKSRTARLANCYPVERRIYHYVADAPASRVVTVQDIADSLHLTPLHAAKAVNSLVERRLLRVERDGVDVAPF